MSGEATSNGDPSLVVGVGASAGGLDACAQLLSRLPGDSGMAFVVVLHLDPTKESHLADILGARSALVVTQVVEPVAIEPDHVYVIAPNTTLELADGMLLPVPLEGPRREQKPVDTLLSSLASAKRETAVAVVLSGIGDDGTVGVQRVHAAGGLCIAQDPGTAQHAGMPRSAIDSGAVNAVLPPESIGRYLMEHAAHPEHHLEHHTMAPEHIPSAGFEGVLALLAARYGLDPASYKPGTLRRRTERRMSLLSISGWERYIEHVHEHPEELMALYRDVLIGVTQFFRDPGHWAYLESEVVPKLLEQHDGDDPLRVWSVGCATGEEPYSLAMFFTEALAKNHRPLRIQLFATDVSQDALHFARQGIYPLDIEKHVDRGRIERFFRRVDDHYQVKRSLRDVVTFAAHDVLSEPPFAQLDLIACRNLFIYLQHAAQKRCLETFHFALRPHGVLWLGTSENVEGGNGLFAPVSSQFRVFEQKPGRERRRVPWSAAPSALPVTQAGGRLEAPRGALLDRRIERAVLERFTAACVVVNDAGAILGRYGPTERYALPPKGATRVELLSWLQPGLHAKLRPALAQAIEGRAKVTVSDARIEREGRTVRVGCVIEPLSSIAEGVFCVVFYDEPWPPPDTRVAQAGADGDERGDVHRLGELLRETERELGGTIDELENANEEFRASYEELVSLNEELQSSNEEVETTKEEAQSINEELMTVNRELDERNATQRALNADLENLLAITTIPTLFLDRELRIRRYTPATERVMWLTRSDVGRPITHIKSRVQDENLVPDAHKVLSTAVPVETEVLAEDGRWYRREIVPFRSDGHVEGVCVIHHDITGQKLAAEESEEARHFAEAIVRTSRLPFIVLDQKLEVVSANAAFFEAFAASRAETVGKPFHRLGNRQWDIPRLREFLREVVSGTASVQDFEVEHTFETIGARQMLINANRMERPERPPLVLVSIEDVTELRDAQRAALRRTRELEMEHRKKDELLAMLGHELRNPLAALVHGLSVLERDPSQVDKIRKLLSRQAKRMTVMLDQLLDLSRVISGKISLAREPIDIADAVMGAIETVTPMIVRAKQELDVSLPPEGTLFVSGDVVRLTQIFENLLTNASKYTDEGGRIWVALKVDGDAVDISVRDTGIGIDVELLQRIFEVFTQGPRRLDRAQGGLGLGLPLVRLLVSMHGGDVKAESEGPGKGSEFTVRLPLIVGAPERDEPERPTKRKSRRVVVVDDERDTADTLSEILEAEGHETRAVYSGEAALEAVRAFRPDVVLLDLGLPDIDGYEVASRLSELDEPPLLIALTGYQRDDRRLAEAGFDDHLIKPLDLDRLAALLAKD